MEEFDCLLYLPLTNQLVNCIDEEEANKIREQTLEAKLYCWLIYIKKEI